MENFCQEFWIALYRLSKQSDISLQKPCNVLCGNSSNLGESLDAWIKWGYQKPVEQGWVAGTTRLTWNMCVILLLVAGVDLDQMLAP